MKIRKPILAYVVNKWVHNRGYLTVARILAGAVLILAGVGKLPEGIQFVDVVIKYHVLPHPIAFGYGVILPWLELGIGLLLVLGLYTRLVAVISLPVIFSFIVANSISLSMGKVVCTSCFGEIIIAVPTPAALVADFILLSIMLSLLWMESKPLVGPKEKLYKVPD
jgi:uncharacterized membrane protein YphA (DoxX/SURF4 family)